MKLRSKKIQNETRSTHPERVLRSFRANSFKEKGRKSLEKSVMNLHIEYSEILSGDPLKKAEPENNAKKPGKMTEKSEKLASKPDRNVKNSKKMSNESKKTANKSDKLTNKPEKNGNNSKQMANKSKKAANKSYKFAKEPEKTAKEPAKKHTKKRARKTKPKPNQLSSTLLVQQYQLYWVKIKGFSMWPAVVERSNGTDEYFVHYFGDYTTSTKLNRSCFLYNFEEGFVVFQTRPKSGINLIKAVKEASLFHLSHKESRQPLISCCICDYLNGQK